MRPFLFATGLAYRARHYRQTIVLTTLGRTCFACFTFWRCHFIILLFTVRYFIKIWGICKEKFISRHNPVPGNIFVAGFRMKNTARHIRCPTTAVAHYRHAPVFRHVLLHAQFREHDGHRPPFQPVSDAQQSSFH